MNNYKKLQIDIDLTDFELGSLALGINSLSDIQLKVQGLLF